jgi:hypothetical protein
MRAARLALWSASPCKPSTRAPENELSSRSLNVTHACRLHAWLPHLQALTSLTLALTFPITWRDLLPASLQHLELSNATEAAVQCPAPVLATLTNLTQLNLQCSPIVDDLLIRGLSPLTALQRLFLLCTSVSGTCFRGLRLPRLEMLVISSRMHAQCLAYIASAAPRLKTLRLETCKKVCVRN